MTPMNYYYKMFGTFIINSKVVVVVAAGIYPSVVSRHSTSSNDSLPAEYTISGSS